MNVPVLHEVHLDVTYKSCSYLTETQSPTQRPTGFIAVYFENHEKCINILCGPGPELFPVIPGDTKHHYTVSPHISNH
jgi:hypothetical protein